MARSANRIPRGVQYASHGAVRRARVQTGTFDGQKRTLWNEIDQHGTVVASYWEDDYPSAPVQVYYR